MRKLSQIYISTRAARLCRGCPSSIHGKTRSLISGHVLLHQEVFVAEVNRLVAGFMALEGDLVDQLYVAPGFQDWGMGDKLIALAKQLRPEGLKLWTFTRNLRARRFYEARGFKASQFTDGTRNEEHEPDVLYTWLPSASISGP